MSLKRRLPLYNNNNNESVDEQGPVAPTKLPLQDTQNIPPSSISITTSEVLLEYLFETRIDNIEKQVLPDTIRKVTQFISSFLRTKSEPLGPIAVRHRSSVAVFTTPAKTVPMASYGPVKKRLKTRYYLENKPISFTE